MAENIWSRWIRFRCTVQHYIDGDKYIEPIIDLELDAESTSGEGPVSITKIIIDDN